MIRFPFQWVLPFMASAAFAADASEFQSPVIAQADGFVVIAGAVAPPDKATTYTALFDAKSAAPKPDALLPAINMAGSELNGLGVAQVPLSHAKFAIVFHGAALEGLLRQELYRRKFGVANPNLVVLAALKKAGVELLACGQQMVSDGLTPAMISSDVTIASDALLVLMSYQNRGYALMSF
jgi:intracellular sulfur oxidation DsrE/DsrF family protein